MTIRYVDPVLGNDANDGTTWAQAKKTIEGVDDISQFDEVRIAKSPDPVSIGNATFTEAGITITLATAKTKQIIENSNWIGEGSVSATTGGANKTVSNFGPRIIIPAGFTTGKVARNDLEIYWGAGARDYSAYTRITFWIKASANVAAGTFRIILGSDNSGNTIVDEFTIDEDLQANLWTPITIVRDGGGNLGSAIKSIAIYADADPGTVDLFLDHFIACNSELHLKTVIGKNTQTEPNWYQIKSIIDTAIRIGRTKELFGTGDTSKFAGLSETVTAYTREMFDVYIAGNPVLNPQTQANYRGGWNKATEVQDGYTFFFGRVGNEIGLSTDGAEGGKTIERIGIVGVTRGISGYHSEAVGMTFQDIHIVGCESAFIYEDVVEAPATYRRIYATQGGISAEGGAWLNAPKLLFEDCIFAVGRLNFKIDSQGSYMAGEAGFLLKGTKWLGYLQFALELLKGCGPFRAEDCTFRKGNTAIYADGGGFGSVFRSCHFDQNGSTLTNSFHTILSFERCTFESTSDEIFVYPAGYIDISIFDCNHSGAGSDVNLISDSREVAYIDGGVKVMVRDGNTEEHIFYKRGGTIKRNDSEFRTNAPSVEMERNDFVHPDLGLKTSFKAPMTKDQSMMMHIYAKKEADYAGNFKLGVMINGELVEQFSPSVITTSYTKFSRGVTTQEAYFDGIAELVVLLDGEPSGTARKIFLDDFSFEPFTLFKVNDAVAVIENVNVQLQISISANEAIATGDGIEENFDNVSVLENVTLAIV